MRKFLFALILFIGIIFIIVRISEFEEILATLQNGELGFLLLAVGLVVLWICNTAFLYKSIYQSLGIRVPLSEIIVISGAVGFANIIAPSGGMSGIAVLVDHARRKGYSTARAAITNTLLVEFDLLGFLVVLAIGIVVLIRRNNLTLPEITASLILLAAVSLLGFLLYLGTKSAAALDHALTWLTQLANKILMPFLHRDYLSIDRAHSFTTEAAEGLMEIRKKPKSILMPAFFGLSGKVLLLGIFATMFLAFHVPISTGTLVSGFSIAYLFLIVSPTPAGLGFVEGALTLALVSMYVPLDSAVVITVAYRAFTFWLPLLFGMVCFRFIGVAKSKNSIEIT